MWGVTITIKNPLYYEVNFNSHARVGRDYMATDLQRRINNFNSHARVGRDCESNADKGMLANFNSHARVGRDFLIQHLFPESLISTHTPVWGVTMVKDTKNTKNEFQLTRPCGA